MEIDLWYYFMRLVKCFYDERQTILVSII